MPSGVTNIVASHLHLPGMLGRPKKAFPPIKESGDSTPTSGHLCQGNPEAGIFGPSRGEVPASRVHLQGRKGIGLPSREVWPLYGREAAEQRGRRLSHGR